MLRAIVGLSLVALLCSLLCQSLPAQDHSRAGDGLRPASPHAVSIPSAFLIELDCEAEPREPAVQLPPVDRPDKPAVARLVTGRLDRQTTHLELLLTCGRLII